MKVYPIFLNNLSGRRCVVFGGNHEAERKVQDLLACDATVEVISASVTPGLATAAEANQIRWTPRSYQPGDLRDAFLTIVSVTDPAATRPIYEEAEREKVLINAMDDVPHCTFVAGSVIRRDPLVISISTSGAAPALSVRLRERLEQEIGPEYETFAALLGSLREPMATRYPDFDERRSRWYRLVDSDLLDVLRDQGTAAARERIAQLVDIPLDVEDHHA